MRDLTPHEIGAIALIRRFEDMSLWTADEPRIAPKGPQRPDATTVALVEFATKMVLPADVVEVLGKMGVKVHQMTWNDERQAYNVIIHLRDVKRYGEKCCEALGLRIGLDGTIWTEDNLIIPTGDQS